MKRLHLVTNGQVIGHLDQDNGGTLRLTVPPRDGAPRLSLAFAPSSSSIPPRKALAYIEGLLPEGDAVRDATARRFGVSPRSPFALLSAIGHDCPGAVQFLDDAALEGSQDSHLVPVDEKQIGERLRALRTNPDGSWVTEGEHWSLGGAQSKAALRLEDGLWHEARGTAATTHIIKPGITALSSQALTEHVCLRAFERLGLPTAASTFLRFDGEPAIVVERYDRIRADGTLYRVHQEDLCQATSTLPSDKYRVTASDVVTTLRRGGASELHVVTFAQAVLANWLIGAPDAHAKNYSIFLTSDSVALAPLYDVATGLGQPSRWPTMAMGIGGESSFSRVTGRHLRRFAEDVGVDADMVLATALVFTQALPAAFEAAAEEVDVPAGDREHLETAGTAIREHCTRALAAIGQH